MTLFDVCLNGVMMTVRSCPNYDEDGRIIVYGTIVLLVIAGGMVVLLWRLSKPLPRK